MTSTRIYTYIKERRKKGRGNKGREIDVRGREIKERGREIREREDIEEEKEEEM